MASSRKRSRRASLELAEPGRLLSLSWEGMYGSSHFIKDIAFSFRILTGRGIFNSAHSL